MCLLHKALYLIISDGNKLHYYHLRQYLLYFNHLFFLLLTITISNISLFQLSSHLNKVAQAQTQLG